VCVEFKPKRAYRRRAQPVEQRRSTRLELKRQLLGQSLLADRTSSHGSSSSSDDSNDDDDSDDDLSGPSPKRTRTEAETKPCSETLAHDDFLSPSDDLGLEESVNAGADRVPRPATDASPVRRRGRPRKVRSESETAPESSGNPASTVVGQDAGVVMSEGSSATQQDGEAGPHPMTLSLSPPPMPAGRVPQPAGVLLLPLYSSTPTEPGEQSSLMIVQPHQLANFPFTGHGSVEAGAYLPPVLTPGQPVVGPVVSGDLCQPAVYALPSATSSHDTKPPSSD